MKKGKGLSQVYKPLYVVVLSSNCLSALCFSIHLFTMYCIFHNMQWFLLKLIGWIKLLVSLLKTLFRFFFVFWKRFHGPNLLFLFFFFLNIYQVIILLLYHGFLGRFYFWTSAILLPCWPTLSGCGVLSTIMKTFNIWQQTSSTSQAGIPC